MPYQIAAYGLSTEVAGKVEDALSKQCSLVSISNLAAIQPGTTPIVIIFNPASGVVKALEERNFLVIVILPSNLALPGDGGLGYSNIVNIRLSGGYEARVRAAVSDFIDYMETY